jgi:hypothetical protein
MEHDDVLIVIEDIDLPVNRSVPFHEARSLEVERGSAGVG